MNLAAECPVKGRSRFNRLHSLLAELHGHFESAVAHGAGADHFTLIHVAPAALHFDAAVLSDRQRFAQEKRNAAEREVAGEDLVYAARAGAVEHRECGFGLHRLAILPPAVTNGLTR